MNIEYLLSVLRRGDLTLLFSIIYYNSFSWCFVESSARGKQNFLGKEQGKNLGIMNHTQRHWRATQLADAMDPFTLKEVLHRATMPFEYVHRAESRRLEREEEADKI